MKRFWIGLIVAWALIIPNAFAGQVFLQSEKHKIIDAQTVNATAEVCSGVYGVNRIGYLSVQWQATSVTGTADVKVEVQGSIDETNFVEPDGTADVTSSDATEAWHIAGIYIPMVRQIKVCVTGVASNPADTLVTVWLARQ